MNPFTKIQRLKKTMKVPDGKSYLRMIYEYLFYKLTNPGLAEQYFNKYLFRRSVTNPTDYIVTHKMAEQIWYYNDMHYKSVFAQKSVFQSFFSKFNINIVKSYAYNVNHLFYKGDELSLIKTTKDFKSFLIDLRDKGLWKENYLIIKRTDNSYGGRNIYKISYKDVTDNKTLIETLYNTVIKSGYLFQDIVVQHPELSRINPNSLNTLRIDTFTNKVGNTRIFNTTLRISSGKAFVDNISSGGIFAGINMETGVLNDEAYGDFDKGTGLIHLSHPLTGLVFKDFKIPYFKEAKQLVKDAAQLLPEARVVGWDVGIQPNGPILLEGNFGNSLYDFEISQKGQRNNPVFQELLNEISVYYGENGNNLDELKKEHPFFK